MDNKTKEQLIADVAEFSVLDADLSTLMEVFSESMIEYLQTLSEEDLIKYTLEYYPDLIEEEETDE